MITPNWKGVMPAITTPFLASGEIDHTFLGEHAAWMIENGCTAIVAGGSLGEAATLSFNEKIAVITTLVKAVGAKVPVILGVAALSTHEAVALTKAAEAAGAAGFMVLPPYVYAPGDWKEMKFHLDAVFRATKLSCMLYNNPIAYKTDFTPEQMKELAAEHANLHAVKESSADVRRIYAIRALLGDRLTICVGVDDAIVEGIDAGAVGWVAGQVNAWPKESVDLFNYAMAGDKAKTFALYRWFLPLLRQDVDVKFVQMIKHCQEAVGRGSRRVRAPRLELHGATLDRVNAEIATALASPPVL
jgi:1-pyrroline-4-hydroxy-2-carboxylate deaminase